MWLVWTDNALWWMVIEYWLLSKWLILTSLKCFYFFDSCFISPNYHISWKESTEYVLVILSHHHYKSHQINYKVLIFFLYVWNQTFRSSLQGQVVDLFKHGNESLGCIKWRKISHQLRNHKKDSAVCSEWVTRFRFNWEWRLSL